MFVGIGAALRYGSAIEWVMLAMGATVIALLASALALQTAFSYPRGVLWALVGSMIAVGLGWLWQRIAFNALVPGHCLEYGFFLKPEGRHARIFLLEVPALAVTSALSLLLVLAVRSAWRAGQRWAILLLLAWWLVLEALFILPHLNWSLQGDAAIFI